MKTLNDIQEQTLNDINTELWNTIDRAKYYGDRISIGKLEELYTTLTRLIDGLEAACPLCDDLYSEIFALEDECDVLESKVESLEEDVGVLESEVERLNKHVSDLESEIGVG